MLNSKHGYHSSKPCMAQCPVAYRTAYLWGYLQFHQVQQGKCNPDPCIEQSHITESRRDPFSVNTSAVKNASPSSRLREPWPSCPFRKLWRPGFSLNCCNGILYKINIGVVCVVRSVITCLDHSNTITLILVSAWFIEVLLYWFCCFPPRIHMQDEQPYFLK